jgi:hypothetical protein
MITPFLSSSFAATKLEIQSSIAVSKRGSGLPDFTRPKYPFARLSPKCF